MKRGATSEVVVIGAGGVRAQAVLAVAARAGLIGNWLAIDGHWREGERLACERLGVSIAELDLFEEPRRMRELIQGAALVVNLAGPSYRTGASVLDACIEAGCDYLDICDDAGATREMLDRDAPARAAGVRALIGMGGAPGLSNVLIRAGVEWLGGADEVSLAWIVDVADLSHSSLQQVWHMFVPPGSDTVLAWEEMSLRSVKFPEPFGERLVIGLTQPEQITVPRFLGLETVRGFGSIVPEDTLVVNWALARLGGSGGGGRSRADVADAAIPTLSSELYEHYLASRAATDYMGSGLVVDVWSGEEGVRFASAESVGIEESAGVPTAAGIALVLEGGLEETGVMAPECLDPAVFFSYLGRLTRGTGSLGAYRLWGSEEGVRIQIRDILMTRTH